MELELELDHEPDELPSESAKGAQQDEQKQAGETVAFDRRRANRPEAPKPSLFLAFQLKTDKIAKIVFSSNRRGMFFVGFQLVCLLVLVWSLGFRYAGMDNNDTREYELLTLQTQLDSLKSEWSDEDLRLIESSLSDAEARVFDDYTAFAAWLRDKTSFASRLGLIMGYRIGDHNQTSLTDTISLPVFMSLKVREGVADNAYVRALEYVRSLIDENRRLEVYGNQIKADRDGITSVDLSIHVWVRSESAVNNDLEPDDSDNPEVSDVAFIQ